MRLTNIQIAPMWPVCLTKRVLLKSTLTPCILPHLFYLLYICCTITAIVYTCERNNINVFTVLLFILEFPYSFVYIVIISWHVFITCRYIPRVETSYLGNVHFPSVGSPSCYPQLSTALTVTGTGRRWDHLVLVHYSCLSIQSPVIIRWVWTITFYNYEIS